MTFSTSPGSSVVCHSPGSSVAPTSPGSSVAAGSKKLPGQIKSSITDLLKAISKFLPKLLIGIVVLAVFYGVLALTVRYGKHHINSRGATVASYYSPSRSFSSLESLSGSPASRRVLRGCRYLYNGTTRLDFQNPVPDLDSRSSVRVGVCFWPHVCERAVLRMRQAGYGYGTAVNCIPGGSIWEQYIILLGVPAAAAVVAKGVTSYKVNNGIVQKVENSGSTGFSVTDVVGTMTGRRACSTANT